MSQELMLKCLIAFILGYFLSKYMGNGFKIGGKEDDVEVEMKPCGDPSDPTSNPVRAPILLSCDLQTVKTPGFYNACNTWTCGTKDKPQTDQYCEDIANEKCSLYYEKTIWPDTNKICDGKPTIDRTDDSLSTVWSCTSNTECK